MILSDDFLPILYIAAVFVSHSVCRSLGCVFLMLLQYFYSDLNNLLGP
jgi:hypothetical protein